MNQELLASLSELGFIAGYNTTHSMVEVHFFNKDVDKNDVVAFLKRDMVWDIREIVSEDSQLFDDKEVVTIHYKSLGAYELGSKFDKFVRAIIDKQYGDDEEHVDEVMSTVLSRNSYEDC